MSRDLTNKFLKETLPAERYNAVYARRAARRLSFALDRYGDDDIGAVSGSISYISRKDAERHSQLVRRSLARVEQRNRILLEIGCGTGGYLRYLSNQMRVRAIGIDSSSIAIAAAQKFATPASEYLCRDAKNSGLPDAFAGVALAMDTFNLTDDPHALLSETFRVLVPNAFLVFTLLYTDRDMERAISEWSSALEATGFTTLEVRNVSTDWQRHMLAKHSWRWERRYRLQKLLGRWVEPELDVSAAMLGLGPVASVAKRTFRLEFVAEKQVASAGYLTRRHRCDR